MDFISRNFTLLILTAIIFSVLTTSCKAEEEGKGDDTMAKVREPAVAGQWYPNNPSDLNAMLVEMFNKAQLQEVEGDIWGMIAPHAGFVYSGWVAAYGFKLLLAQPDDYKDKTFIIMGISHRVSCDGIAVWGGGPFKTPPGELEIDREMAEKLVNYAPSINFNAAPHLPEHSIEAELPFLQYALGSDVKIVPIIFCQQNISTVNTLVDALLSLPDQEDLFFITSTDMSHYHPYAEAREIDHECLEATVDLEVDKLIDKLQSQRAEYCGYGPVLTLMELAKARGGQATLLNYATSGDVQFGDKSKVVGYSSIAFSGKDGNTDASSANEGDAEQESSGSNYGEHKFTDEEKEYLVNLARATLELYLEKDEVLNVEKLPDYDILKKERAVFVTLEKDGRLRGCIGGMVATMPLYRAVIDKAIAAATKDYRFPQVTLGELENIDIEISVLSPLRKIESYKEIEPFKHGVYVQKGANTGVYLPQVWEQIPDKTEFLESLCAHKAFISADAYKDPQTDLYVYTVVKFSEEEMEQDE